METDSNSIKMCRFGVDCRYLPQNRCFNFHPEWQKKMCQNRKGKTQSKRPCKYGKECKYLRQGQCRYDHPSKHQNTNLCRLPERLTIPSPEASNCLISSVKKRVTSQLFVSRQWEQNKKRQEKQKKQQELQDRRLAIEMQQRERQIEYERLTQLIAELIARLQLPPAQQSRIQQQKKLRPEQFEWYFSKNRTFKACEISEEKLHDLNQCVICFANFTEDKDYLQNDLTELYCKHTFHKNCIKEWLNTNPKCPVCRKEFQDHDEIKKCEEEQKQLIEEEQEW